MFLWITIFLKLIYNASVKDFIRLDIFLKIDTKIIKLLIIYMY